MSVKPNRKHPVLHSISLTDLMSHAMCEKAFSLIELMTVIIIIAVMLGVTTIVWQATARSMDVQAAAEMMKEDIRKVYALAAQGQPRVENGITHRDQYRLEIYTSAAKSPDIPNTYKISTRQWSGGDWSSTWTPVTVLKSQASRMSNGYIKLGNYSSMNITVPGSALEMYPLIFEARGSIVHVMNPSSGKAEAVGDTVIRLNNTKKSIDITVSIYGDVS
jgi:prepilin-type N-terminal cleavage/methylation domain-containing protein